MSHNEGELIIHVMHGYDSLEAPDGTKCFGVYIKGENEIYVASDIPDNQLFHTIAHEYCHYLQERDNREFDEEEADKYANMLFDTTEHDKQTRQETVDEILTKLPIHFFAIDGEFYIKVHDVELLRENNK